MSDRPPIGVLLVAHYFPPHVGGIENVVREQARHLTALGARVTVLTTAVGAPPDPEGYDVVRVAAWNGVERRTGVPFPVVAPWAIPTIVRQVRRCDVVHLHDLLYMTTWIAAACALLLGKPLVLTQHVALVDHPSPLVVGVQRVVYRLIGAPIARAAGRVMYLNAQVREFLVSLGAPPDRLEFVPNGVDTERFKPGEPDDRPGLRGRLGLPTDRMLALFVGRFVPKKGYHVLLALASPWYDIVMVGDDPAERDRARNGFVFLGRLTGDDLVQAYRACDVFVLPSTSEGFPLVVQEAMACAMPVVTSDDPGYAVYGLDGDRVALVGPEPAAVGAALERLALDDALRRDMADYSLRFARQRFGWPMHAATLIAAYLAVTEGARR